jgi:peptidoglycan/LPS O-acetylase OafA/YrhL
MSTSLRSEISQHEWRPPDSQASKRNRPELIESRIPALDGLRGIAILMVLLLHLAPYGHDLPAPTAVVDRAFLFGARTGWMGVDLFFVLSGFLITGILYDTRGSKHYFRQFYARRMLRIFPLYYAALALFLIILPALRPEHWVLRDLKADAFWYWTYLYNMKVASTGFLPSSALGHFWSLAVEEQFYLIWPIAVLCLSRRQLLITCSVAAVAALACRVALSFTGYAALPDVWMAARMDSLAIGAFIALAARSPDGHAALSRWAGPVAKVVAVPLVALLVYKVAIATVAHSLVALFFGAMLVYALNASPNSVGGKVIGSPILRFFGRYSYALYVFHHPLLWFKPAFSMRFVPTVFGSQMPAYLLWLVISIGVTVACALISWHLVEKQFLKMKKFFPYDSGDVAAAIGSLASENLPDVSPATIQKARERLPDAPALT